MALRLLLLSLPVFAAAGLTYAALNSPWLSVRSIEVRGAETLDEAALVEISGLHGKSMFQLPAGEARERLLEVPQVGDVTIERHWPNKVTLAVTERRAVALWTVGGIDYAVDGDGVVLGPGAPDHPAPHIIEPEGNRTMTTGDRVHPDAIGLAQRIYDESPRFLGEPVDRLEYSAAIGVTAVFKSGMRVTFGDERSYDYKIAVLAKILDSSARTPRNVDLRFGTRVTYD